MNEKKYSVSEIKNRIALYREKITKLEDALLTLREVDAILADEPFGGIPTLSNEVPRKNTAAKVNDFKVVIDIIKSSPKDLTTKEIVQAYAKMTDSEVKDVRGFVDVTLNRFKGTLLEKYKVGTMKGSYYKLKVPETVSGT